MHVLISKDSYFTFPASEVQLKPEIVSEIIVKQPSFFVVTDYTMNGFMALVQAVDINKKSYNNLRGVIYPYLPYGRQDRHTTPTSPFSLKNFADMFNSLGDYWMLTWDPHSTVYSAVFNKSMYIPQHSLASKVLEESEKEYEFIIAPDAGASHKAWEVAKALPYSDKVCVITATKDRDPSTGEVTGYMVPELLNFDDSPVLVVDDICDGGRTFVELAKHLATEYYELDLWVTHGIFSKGVDVLRNAGYNHIYTTNSFEQGPLVDTYEVPNWGMDFNALI